MADIVDHAADQATIAFQEGQLERLRSRLQRQYLVNTVQGVGLTLLILGCLVLILRSGVMPYLVMIDPQGKPIWHGTQESYTLTDYDVAGRLAEWVEWVRIQPNAEEVPLLRRHWTKASQMLTASGLPGQVCKAPEQFEAYVKQVQAEQSNAGYNRMRVLIEPTTFDPEGETRIQINFDETRTPMLGPATTVKMAAKFEVYRRPPPGPFGPKLTVADLQRSLLGIFVCNFSFRTALQEVKAP